MLVLSFYLLKEPAGIALLYLYPLRIWGPILAPKKIYPLEPSRSPLQRNTLDAPPIPMQYLLDSKETAGTTVSSQSNRHLDSNNKKH